MVLQGVCVDLGGSTNLKIEETYYLFPHGGQAFNVSRFPRKGSHFGTYQKNRFEVIDPVDDWPTEPTLPVETMQLENGKVYKAELIWRKKGYSYDTPLGDYFITAVNSNITCKTDCCFYKDAALQQPQGRFPLHWFTNIQEHDETTPEDVELPRNEWQQMDLFSF